MAIVFSEHVLTRLAARGTSEAEIDEVLAKGVTADARPGRLAKAMVLPYGRSWGAKTYEQKRVKVIYAEDGEDTFIVTVYVYYGSWQ